MSRSRFLTTVGLAGFAGGGCATMICALAALIAWIVRPAMRDLDRIPSYLQPLYADPRLVTSLATVASLAVLTAGWGLVRRREWARRLAIAVSVAGAGWVLAALTAIWGIGSLPQRQGSTIIAAANTLVGLAVLILLVWLVRTLTLPAIKAEFAASAEGRRTTQPTR